MEALAGSQVANPLLCKLGAAHHLHSEGSVRLIHWQGQDRVVPSLTFKKNDLQWLESNKKKCFGIRVH